MRYLFERCSDKRVSSAIRHSHVLGEKLASQGRVCLLPGRTQWSIRMNWVRAIAGVLVLWSGTAWGATLTWNANSEPDLAGYRVYQCSQQPCTRSSGKASLLATLGKVTSFNIGTPSVTQYYFITAYDSADNESVVATSRPSHQPELLHPLPAAVPDSTADSRRPAHHCPAVRPVGTPTRGTSRGRIAKRDRRRFTVRGSRFLNFEP